jgi:uncharacterized membrane protein
VKKKINAKVKKRKPKVSNIALLFLAVSIPAFIVAMIVTFWVHGSVPDTLIQYTLGAGGIETLALAFIKIAKTIKGEKQEEDTNEI